jgi:hypothetical protein
MRFVHANGCILSVGCAKKTAAPHSGAEFQDRCLGRSATLPRKQKAASRLKLDNPTARSGGLGSRGGAHFGAQTGLCRLLGVGALLPITRARVGHIACNWSLK